MRPNELRIGNYIYYDKNVIVKVERIESTEFNDWNGSGDQPVLVSLNVDMRQSAVINPIPLTEEILFKCGFEKTDEKYLYFERSDIVGMIQLYDGVAQYSIDSNDVCWINNLHQLQNLYFALTGIELEIKF